MAARFLLVEFALREEYLERRRSRRRLRNQLNLSIIPDVDFVGNYRLSRQLFEELCQEIVPLLPPKARSHGIEPTVKILAALNFYAQGSYQRSVGQNMDGPMAQQTFSRCLQEVTAALNTPNILKKYIRFPQNRNERNIIKRQFYEKHGLSGVIGCIDCTHIAIVRPSQHEEQYFNRKHFHSINTQVISDIDCYITNVDASYGGATHDAYIWRECDIRSHMESLQNETAYLLGDSGYALREHMMTPIDNAVEDSPEGRYNAIQKRARSTVERTFGILKGRWRCLLAARQLHYCPETAGKIILACCVLHNLCLWAGIDVPELTEEELQAERSRQVPSAGNQPIASSAQSLLAGRRARAALVQMLEDDISSDAVVTATLISKIDDVFDSLNADSPDLNRGKPYSTNLTQRSRHLQLFHEMKNLFLEVEFIGARCAPPSVNGWIKTIRAVERLWHNLRKHEINSLATRRINQDPLENLFGCIRSHCGSNPNPTIQQFIGGLKTSIINNLRYQSTQKNCEDDNNTLLTNMSTYINTKQKQIATTSQNQLHDFEINEEDQKEIGEMQACAYICGFIYRKLKHKDCESCKKIMLTNDFATVHTFTNFKEYNESRSSLNYVTDDFIQCVEACATNINNYLEINAYTTGLKKNLRKNLNNVTCSWLDGCKQHKTETFDHIANSVLCITIKRYCILKNRMFAEDASANAMKRKISILKHV